jgi:hypothetical protein
VPVPEPAGWSDDGAAAGSEGAAAGSEGAAAGSENPSEACEGESDAVAGADVESDPDAEDFVAEEAGAEAVWPA